MRSEAAVMLRPEPPYRRDSFVRGLEAAGYRVSSVQRPSADGVLVIWNRYGSGERIAREYDRAGGRVLVAENGYLGRDWRGGHWYAISRDLHNGAGTWPDGGPERWDSWHVQLAPWRDGREIVVLETRSIGPEGVCEPRGWSRQIVATLKAQTDRPIRVRPHPGEKPAVPLEYDLREAWAVVTWGSGAALKALAYGVPVFYGFPKWIGGAAARRVEEGVSERLLGDRVAMFRRLAWAMWSTDEIAAGEPFRWLL